MIYFFRIYFQDGDFQDFDTRWGQIFIGTSEVPPENVFEGLYRNISQGSKQLQTVFAMYNQELSRDRLPSKLSTVEENDKTTY